MKISLLTLSSSEIASNKSSSTIATIRAALYKNGQEVVSSTTIKPLSQLFSSSLDYALKNSDCIVVMCEESLDKPYMAKKVICDKFGAKIVQSMYAQKNIEDYARFSNVPLQKENMTFAQMPDIARTIKNPFGFFQGALCEKDGKMLFLLPVGHNELTHIFFASVLPYILQSKEKENITFVLKTFGIKYSEMVLLLKDFVYNKHAIEVLCNEYLGLGEVILNVPKSTRKDVADNFVQSVYEKLLPYVYSDKDETESEFIHTLLTMQNKKLILAEDFTSGGISLAFASNLLCPQEVVESSFVVKTNESKIKLLGVDEKCFQKANIDYEEVAYQMAVGLLSKSEDAIAVATFGDVESGNLVFSIGTKDGVHIFSESVEGSLSQKIEMATNAVLFSLIKKIRQNNFGLGKTII